MEKPKEDLRVGLETVKDELAGFLDIDRQLRLALADHERWGILELFQNRGVVADIHGYEELLKGATVDESSLLAVKELLQQRGREAVKVVVNPGSLPLADYYEALFVNGGLVAPNVLEHYRHYLDVADGMVQEPSLAFVPIGEEFQIEGSSLDVSKLLEGSHMHACDPVTDWLFWRRDLDKNIRILLAELQSEGSFGKIGNFGPVQEWFKFAAKYSMGRARFPRWTDFTAEDYKKWCRLYLQAAGSLGLNVGGKNYYSQYPQNVHKDSGLVLGTGLVSRPMPNEMTSFLGGLPMDLRNQFQMPNWVDTLLPEPVFLAPDRQDPWVRTRGIF